MVSDPSLMTPNEARAALTSYLEKTTQADRAAILRSSDPPLLKLGKSVLPPSVRLHLRLIVTDLLRWRERKRSANLSYPLRLHLGSGLERKPGWTNVDIFDYGDIALNLTRRIPLPSDSVEAIFQEHLMEHLTIQQGLFLLSESWRIMRTGGILRIGVPDTSGYIDSYVGGGEGLIEMIRPGRPTSLLAMQEIFYWYGHRTMYDFETLALTCRAAGFANEIEPRAFGDSRLRPAPDTDSRRGETFYIETVR
jgi:predicted SAM-dependent methyltransferase